MEARITKGAPICQMGVYRRHHDQLAVAVHAVERVEGSHEHGIGGDQRHQAGQGEKGHLQEQQEALPLGHDQVELLQCGGEPDNRGQGDQDDDERVRHLPKDVSAEKSHAASLGSPYGPPGWRCPETPTAWC